MHYSIENIARIIDAETAVLRDSSIEHLLLDSRKVHSPANSLFFALKSARRNGHHYIPELYKTGVRNFVISDPVDPEVYPEANFLRVDDTLIALQQLVAHHRGQFSIPVIGITGSNGKTIVKEWLYQLLQDAHSIVRSPKSFNSQIGVPLSVWQMEKGHTLGIFEAGISEQGEMLRLEKIIRPTIGILTTIGEAHSEGFIDQEHKFREKLSLFRNSGVLLGRNTDIAARREVIEMLGGELRVITWGPEENNEFIVREITKSERATSIRMADHAGETNLTIPFTDDAAIENAITCYCVLRVLETDPQTISEGLQHLQPVNMRLELKKGINQTAIINDSYSADLSSLEMALGFLDQQSQGTKKTVILSDFLQSALSDEELYEFITLSLKKHNVTRLVGIGERISAQLKAGEEGIETELYSSTEDFIKKFRTSHFKDETILVKGARVFAFERIVQLLEQKVHQTVLEINLNSIAHNLKEYQRFLQPETKLMAMVKAFAYGSGGAEIAGILQFHKVDYLAVAYADEGIELRKAGISLPVMVMNPEETAYAPMAEYDLEPEIFSFNILQSLDTFLQREGIQQYPVHIEIETGMNRLGFDSGEINKLGDLLRASRSFHVKSVFTHLAASEEASQDEFTTEQFRKFEKAAVLLQEKLGYSFLRHIANSAAVIRHPQLQMDMVRLGIGLYGVDSAESNKVNLQTVATLRSTIAQLKNLKAGESVSYNRKGVVDRDSVIATVRLGYADGYPRRLGNKSGKMYIKGKLAPLIGSVCMDMTMIDVTDIPGVREGDEVIVFGKEIPVQQLAEWAGTIPYEIMTGISQRVKRVYFEE